jgi:hypothetical protein
MAIFTKLVPTEHTKGALVCSVGVLQGEKKREVVRFKNFK